MTQVINDEQSSPIKTQRIIKSHNKTEGFSIDKLRYAINSAVPPSKAELRQSLENTVLSKIKDFVSTTTAYINDIIESYLVNHHEYEVFNNYLVNRLKKNEELATKVNLLGARLITAPYFNKNELDDFSVNQIQIAATRYLLKDMETGEVVESMTQWFDRVAKHVVLGSVVYDPEVYDRECKQKAHESIYTNSQIFSKDDGTVVNLDPSHIDILRRIYVKLDNERKMKGSFVDFVISIDFLLRTEKYLNLYATYFNYMYNGIFEPNTPTLMNAGTANGKCSACFTLDVHDDMHSIMGINSDAAFIFQGAGGLGTNISYIRPKGSNIGTSFGAATGPIELVLEIIDFITQKVKSGGKRRGANMGLMEYWHPQIQEFITMKQKPGYLENFNVSVLFDEKFWNHYYQNKDYPLVFNDKIYGFMNPRTLIESIAVSAWSSAEPGVAFKDNANKANPLKGLRGDIHLCNPCAEQFMYDGESCTLGSINLSKFIIDGKFDWNGFKVAVRNSTIFLNDVLEINLYPTEHIREETDKVKRIGLGIMGLADALFKLKIPYNSERGYNFMGELSRVLYIESVKASIDLAEERGSCYWYDELVQSGSVPTHATDRVFALKNDHALLCDYLGTEYSNKLEKFGVRNMWTTTVAPTGTISMIANCSGGLEPVFSLAFTKITNAGTYNYISDLFKEALIQEGIYSPELIQKVEKNYGSCQGIDEIPKWMQEVFVTAIDLHWMDHVVAQSIWQQWIDNSISKTINMPYNVTVKDVRNAYMLAHELGLKGIALFRDGSRNEQVLHVGSNVQSNKNEQNVQKDTPGTVTAPVNNQVERTINPSQFAWDYVRKNVSSDRLIQELTEGLSTVSTFTHSEETCPKCEKGVLVEREGCVSCVACGHSTSCIVG